MASTGVVIAALAASAFFLQAAMVVRAPRTEWSRLFAATLFCVGAYELCDGLSVTTKSHATFEFLAKGSWFLAPMALIFWWMTTGKLVRANPTSLHGYLRSTATVALMMFAAAVAAFGFVDEGLFASGISPVNSPWTNYTIAPSPLYVLMIVLMVSVMLVSVINVALARHWRPASVSPGLIVTTAGFAILGPLTSINFYFDLKIPEPAIMSILALTAYPAVRSLSVVSSNTPLLARSPIAHAGDCVGLHVPPSAPMVWYRGATVRLAFGEFEVLRFLALRPDELVTYEEIDARLGYTAESTHTFISEIRRKLALDKHMIRSVKGRGYVLDSRCLCLSDRTNA